MTYPPFNDCKYVLRYNLEYELIVHVAVIACFNCMVK